MLEVLRDGQRHSRRDLFERIGYFLTNNAASELRAQGYDVEQTRENVNGDVVYYYRLRGSLSERETHPAIDGTVAADARLTATRNGSPDLDASRSESESVAGLSADASPDGKLHDRTGGRLEQGSLFDVPRRPAWH
jgi:hypothetical protein